MCCQLKKKLNNWFMQWETRRQTLNQHLSCPLSQAQLYSSTPDSFPHPEWHGKVSLCCFLLVTPFLCSSLDPSQAAVLDTFSSTVDHFLLLLLWLWCSLWCFSLFLFPPPLCVIFCPFLNMLLQRCCQLGWWAQLGPAVGPLWSWLEQAVSSMAATPASAHTGLSCIPMPPPLIIKTLPSIPDTPPEQASEQSSLHSSTIQAAMKKINSILARPSTACHISKAVFLLGPTKSNFWTYLQNILETDADTYAG